MARFDNPSYALGILTVFLEAYEDEVKKANPTYKKVFEDPMIFFLDQWKQEIRTVWTEICGTAPLLPQSAISLSLYSELGFLMDGISDFTEIDPEAFNKSRAVTKEFIHVFQDEFSSFGDRFYALRYIAGVPQDHLATVIGTPQSNISLWEQGSRTPRSDNISLLAEILHCSTALLFPPQKGR